MESILIKTSSDGNSWSDLQTPSAFKLNYEDLDNDSYRSVTNGNLIRNRIKPRWIKLELSYNLVSDTQLDTIAKAINTNQKFYIRCKAPAFGNMDASGSTSATDKTWVQFQCYCSQFNAEMIEGQKGWTLSFNIIQSDGGTFQ